MFGFYSTLACLVFGLRGRGGLVCGSCQALGGSSVIHLLDSAEI